MKSHTFFTLCAIFLQFIACLAASYGKCHGPNFECGGINMSYPFGILNQGCGVLGFQVECEGNPQLHVHRIDYRILNASLISQRRITIVNQKLFQPCGLDPDVYDDLNNSHFLVSRQNFNVTELRDCGKNPPKEIVELKCNGSGEYEGWYLGSGVEKLGPCTEIYPVPVLEKPKTLPKRGSDFLQLLRKGFQVECEDPKIIFPECGSCEAKNGICGYYPFTETFCCYCPDGKTHLFNCSDGIGMGYAYHRATRSKSISPGAIIGIAGTVLVVALLFIIAYGRRRFFNCRVLGRKHIVLQSISKGFSFASFTASLLRVALAEGLPALATEPTSAFPFPLVFLLGTSQPAYLSGVANNGCEIRDEKTGIAGAIIVVALLFIIAYARRRFFNRRVLGRKHIDPQSISKVETFLQNYVDQMPNRFSYSSLKKITNNFADKLGEGGFGMVYKGKLPSGNFVAVKVLDQSRQSETQFINEVATIGRIHHLHLVRLLGYCFEGHTAALVYEYMANGSLDRFILARKEDDRILNWDQLYSIALGVARGIAYLHNECNSRIIHFDIKPHNVLLDEEFTAKVADFGLAKLCGRRDEHVSMTAARGTPGYVAPEVWSRGLGPVTDKSDVYSFGMMLLEMVGGRKNIDVLVSHSSQFYFPDWAYKLLERGELRTRLRERELSEAEEGKTRSLTKVGLWCIRYDSTDRPSMVKVLQMLEENADDIPNPPTPFNARPASAPLPGREDSSSIEIIEIAS